MIGVDSTPVRPADAEKLLKGAAPDAAAFEAAGKAAAAGLDPPSDLHGSAAYRKKVGAVLVRRALQQATERAVSSK